MIVPFGFYAWAIVALMMLILILKNALNPRKAVLYFGLICAVWLMYLTTFSIGGILDDFSFPPRVPLLVVAPALMTILFITGGTSFRHLLQQTPLQVPVFLQSFRIVVELLIYGAFLQGTFPRRVTFEGLNYDILVGISALIMGSLILKDKIGYKGILVWNFASLMILSVTAYSFISAYYFSDFFQNGGTNEFVRFPYLLLPAVLLPVALFLHVFSIRQLLSFIRRC